MLTSPFTEEQKEFIRNNYKRLTAQQIANKFKVARFQVYNFRQAEGLIKTEKKQKAKVIDGYFDVNARENWAV